MSLPPGQTEKDEPAVRRLMAEVLEEACYVAIQAVDAAVGCKKANFSRILTFW
jgi:hypothetical protein